MEVRWIRKGGGDVDGGQWMTYGRHARRAGVNTFVRT